MVCWLASTAPALALDPAITGTAPSLYWLSLRGPLIPAMNSYLESGIQSAELAGAEALVISIDSRGGDVRAVPTFLTTLLSTKLPIIIVLPTGAEAATSAPYLLTVADILIVGPDTTVGPLTRLPSQALQPFSLLGILSPAQPGLSADETMLLSQSQELVRSFAHARGMGTLGGSQLGKAFSTPIAGGDLAAAANAGIELPDTRASEVLTALHGYEIQNPTTTHRLRLAGASVVPLQPAWYLQLAQLLADPVLVVLLLLIGLVGLVSELLHPGGIIPGAAGVLALGAAGWLFTQLPVTPFGLALIVLGSLLMLGEAKVGGPGYFGIPGAICFIGGIWNLIPDVYAPLQANRVALLASGGLVIGLGMLAINHLQRSLRSRVDASSDAGLLGELAEVKQALDPVGMVYLNGEYWSATGPQGLVIPVGTGVRVESRIGMMLRVTLAEDRPEATTMPEDSGHERTPGS